MSLQRPKRVVGSLRRVAFSAVLGSSLVLLSSCSSETQGEWKRIAMPDPVSQQGEPILSLWQGAWIAAMVTGVIVWALILYAVVAFRRRSPDEVPIQTRYNLPLEIFYTIAPIIMVIVFFSHTVQVQNTVLDDHKPDVTIEVVGQQWQWSFNYGVGEQSAAGMSDESDDQYPYSRYVYDVGTGSNIPTLVLPVDQVIQFNLHSPDVIHDFGVPAFLMKMDVIPGRVNHYQITPTTIGTYEGKCFELCGVYHSRMLFEVKIVSQDDYAAYLTDREATGAVSDTPLLGGTAVNTQDGLAPAESAGGSQ